MPILMNKNEWARILKWTDSNKEDPEAARRREYVKYLDETSKKMTKSWPNSLENVSKRNEEERRARIEAAETANSNFYKKYVKRQKEEQQRLMYSARDTIFKNKDAPKLLLSAVIETAIQKEREEQLKFIKERRRVAAEQKKNEDNGIHARAKAWHELQSTKQKRRLEVNKQHQKDLVEQAHEIFERNRTEHEDELNRQRVDNIKAQEQIDAIKEHEKHLKEMERQRIWSDNERSRLELEKRRAEQRARDKMDDDLIDVINKSRCRIENMRKKTEKEAHEERLRVLEKISQKLESGDAAREAKEQAILDKAIKEKETAEEARREARRIKDAKNRAERIESREQFLRDEAQRLHEKETMQSWALMNRFKNVELNADYQEKRREEDKRKVKQYREEILRLWREREDRETREAAELRHYYGEQTSRAFRHADNKLLTHAESLLAEARSHGRPELPLRKAIDSYCKLYRLYPLPKLPSSLQEHFQQYAPKDGSFPDPDYVEPPPPVVEGAPAHNRQRNDGLHETDTSVQQHEQSDATPESEEYKRHGRADGLQRKPSPQAIGHVPCVNPNCNCQLKP